MVERTTSLEMEDSTKLCKGTITKTTICKDPYKVPLQTIDMADLDLNAALSPHSTPPVCNTDQTCPKAKNEEPVNSPSSSSPSAAGGQINIGSSRHPVLRDRLKFHNVRRLPNAKKFILSAMDITFTKDELQTGNLEGGQIKYNGVVSYKKKLCADKFSAIFWQAAILYNINEEDLRLSLDIRNSINSKCRSKRLATLKFVN